MCIITCIQNPQHPSSMAVVHSTLRHATAGLSLCHQQITGCNVTNAACRQIMCFFFYFTSETPETWLAQPLCRISVQQVLLSTAQHAMSVLTRQNTPNVALYCLAEMLIARHPACHGVCYPNTIIVYLSLSVSHMLTISCIAIKHPACKEMVHESLSASFFLVFDKPC